MRGKKEKNSRCMTKYHGYLLKYSDHSAKETIHGAADRLQLIKANGKVHGVL
jgi:hypothetical protein